MTIREIEALDRDFLTVAEVAGCIHCSPQLIRDEAEKNPKYLGFPIMKAGKSFNIPREGFVRWAKGQVPVMKWPWTYEQMKAFAERGIADCL